jgi:phosphatidylglycerol:prolipoprotein diacylglycerol transferase
MYPDLSYILHGIFGIEPDNWASVIKTFGLMLAFAFLASAWILSLEMKRLTAAGILKPVQVKVVEGEPATVQFALIQALIGFVIGFKAVYIFQNSEAFLADAASVLLSTTGSTVGGILGALIFGGLQYYLKNKKALPKPKETMQTVQPYQMVGDITVMAAISGLIGAKVFAIFESAETISRFVKDPIGQLFSGTGLAIYGGLIVAFFVVLRFVRKQGFPGLNMMDAAAPGMITGYAVGRIGCQLSGDGDWGIASAAKPAWLQWVPDNLWGQTYPHNVLKEGVPMQDCVWDYCTQLAVPVYPTPVYETIMGFMILGILWALRKRVTAPGFIFFLYAFLAGIERFFVEKIRVNDTFPFLGMEVTQAEIISVVFMLLGIGGMIWTKRRMLK